MKTPERLRFALAPLALTALAAIATGCGDDAKESPIVEEAEEEPQEPIPPPEVVLCGPQITCAGPTISNEVGFTRVRVGVALENEGCWNQSAGKSVWLGASPANQRVVTEDGEHVQPNVSPDLLLPENDTVVMPVSPGRTENRGTIRRDLTVPNAGADSILVALQVNDIEVDAAARNVAARDVNVDAPDDDGDAPDDMEQNTIPVRACFECLTEDQRACEEPSMTEEEYDACRMMYDPSIESEVVQVAGPTAEPTDVQPCEDEPSEPEASVQSVRKAVDGIIAQLRARAEQRDAFRRFVADRSRA